MTAWLLIRRLFVLDTRSRNYITSHSYKTTGFLILLQVIHAHIVDLAAYRSVTIVPLNIPESFLARSKMVVQLSRSFSRSFDLRKLPWYDHTLSACPHTESWTLHLSDCKDGKCPKKLYPLIAQHRIAATAPLSVPRAPEHRRKNAHPCRASESVASETVSDASAPLHVSSPTVPGAMHLQHPTHSPCEKNRVHHLLTAGHGGVRKVKKPANKATTELQLALKVCFSCGVTKTPMWRRVDDEIYCNACGLKRKRAASGR